MKDELGDRMKSQYEVRTKVLLPRRIYTIIRIDGKAFHTYTKGLKTPFDYQLVVDMNATAEFLCKEIQGAKLAFTQSDEISILLTDFDSVTTDAWFNGNVQKIVSVSASLATAKFNELRPGKMAFFDSRVFVIADFHEVLNYFIWRQQDTVRNSITSAAQALYSHKELEHKNTSELQEMCFEKGVNWNDYPGVYKRGRITLRDLYVGEGGGTRTRWISMAPPTFTKETDFLRKYIPIL